MSTETHSDHHSTVEPNHDEHDYEESDRAAMWRTSIGPRLAALGAVAIEYTYSGYGDAGADWDLTAYRRADGMEEDFDLPAEMVPEIGEWCEAFVESDYEMDAGGGGTVRVTVETGFLTHDSYYNEDYRDKTEMPSILSLQYPQWLQTDLEMVAIELEEETEVGVDSELKDILEEFHDQRTTDARDPTEADVARCVPHLDIGTFSESSQAFKDATARLCAYALLVEHIKLDGLDWDDDPSLELSSGATHGIGAWATRQEDGVSEIRELGPPIAKRPTRRVQG
jgi:hypothetical protein